MLRSRASWGPVDDSGQGSTKKSATSTARVHGRGQQITEEHPRVLAGIPGKVAALRGADVLDHAVAVPLEREEPGIDVAAHADEGASLGGGRFAVGETTLEIPAGKLDAGERPLPSSVASCLADRMMRPNLTARELDVLQLIAKGMRNKEIAGELGISEETTQGHVKSILFKLGVHDRTEAVAIAVRHPRARPKLRSRCQSRARCASPIRA